MYSNEPPPDDDDATRIYRPYGSPPPDADGDGDGVPAGKAVPDPFQPPAPSPARPEDPFAPASPSAAPDPFAPPVVSRPPAAPTAADPFARRPPAPATLDPFAPPTRDPFAAPASDPFAPAAQAQPPAPDPFAPTSDPFAPAAQARRPALDPFAPPTPGPSAPIPMAPRAVDPFAPPPRDPYAAPNPFDVPGSTLPPPALNESFLPPTGHASPDLEQSPLAPQAPDPFAMSERDPFHAAAPLSAGEQTPDPFKVAGRDPFEERPQSANAPDPFDLGPRSAAPAPRAAAAPPAAVKAGPGRLADAFSSVFALILQLRSTADFGDPTGLRERAEALLDRAAAQARANGAEPADVREAEYCVVAFLDETVLTSEAQGRHGWAAHPLQLARYERYDAGEAFFDRLRQLLTDGGRLEVLEVYYLCIALGYKGRYQIHGREVLGQLVEDLKARLAKGPGGGQRAISPHGLPRGEIATAASGGFPAWALFAGAAALVLLLYLGLSLSVSGIARDVAREVRTLQSPAASAAPAR